MTADTFDPHESARREIAQRFGPMASLVIRNDQDGKPWFHIGIVADPQGTGLSLTRTYGCGRTPAEAMTDAQCGLLRRRRGPREFTGGGFKSYADYAEAKKAKAGRRKKVAS